MRVTKPRAWLGVAALGLAVAALLVWGFAGNVPQTISSSGVIASRLGVEQVESTRVGSVTEVMVDPGEDVSLGEPILRIENAADKPIVVRADIAGEVVAVQAAPGRVVKPGTPLFTLEPPHEESEPDEVVLFLDPEHAAQVFPGMEATISTLNYGTLDGVVEQVRDAPASTADLEHVAGNDLLVDELGEDLHVIARVAIEGAADTRLASGALVTATITLQDRRPIDVVFG